MFESLRSLSDHEIISRTETLVARERKITLGVLLHLNEIERRKLHLTRGHATLFAYCTAGLGYSAGSAMRRIQAARCVARFPEVRQLLESNQVNLSTLGLVSGILSPSNKDELLKRICGKSQREVEAIAAEYDPKAAIPRDRVRSIAVLVPVACAPEAHFRSGNRPDGSSADVATAEGREPSQQKSVAFVPREPIARAAVLERRAMIQFCPSEAFMAKVEQVRSLAAHRLPAHASLEQIFELALDLFIDREDPRARMKRRTERRNNGDPKTTNHANARRAIPARVRDEIFARDGGRCMFVSPSGKRCNSTHMLQVDHRTPVARGGMSTIDNLRLLCAYHNRFEAERLMGPVCFSQVRQVT